MRFLNKYKLYEKRVSSDWKIPKRVLKFKRPKWDIIKKKFKIYRFKWHNNRRYKRIPKYRNHLKIKVKRRYYGKKFFRLKQETKTYMSSLFEKSIKFKKTTTAKDRHTVVSSFLIRPFYRIDILLWYLDFFHSSFESRKFINARNARVNGQVVGSNYELKMGDIVTLTYDESLLAWLNLCGPRMYNRYKKGRHFFPFLEYDFYTHTIVILKDWNVLSSSDMSLLIKKNKKKLKYVSYR